MIRKSFIALSLVFIFTAFANATNIYDMSVPLEGSSIASDKLQQKVLMQIYPIAASYNPACTSFKVSDTQLLHYPYDTVKKNGRYVKGYWKELWTVNYCGEKIQLPVTFTINKKKTTFLIERNILPE